MTTSQPMPSSTPVPSTLAMIHLTGPDGKHPDLEEVRAACRRIRAPREGNNRRWSIDNKWGKRLAQELGCTWKPIDY